MPLESPQLLPVHWEVSGSASPHFLHPGVCLLLDAAVMEASTLALKTSETRIQVFLSLSDYSQVFYCSDRSLMCWTVKRATQ